MPSVVNLSRFEQRMDVLRKTTPPAVEHAMGEILGQMMGNIIDKTPRDTNRLVQGFVQAANQAGLGPFVAPPIRDSKYLPGTQKTLRRQVVKLSNFVRFLSRNGPPEQNRSYRKLLKDLERAKAELESLTGTSILIINKGRGVAYTVRNKIYGGAGQRSTLPNGGLKVTISNKEPHAIIRERVGRLVATEINLARTSGVRRGKRIIMNEFDRAGALKGK